MSDLLVAITAAVLTIAGTFLIEQWQRRAQRKSDARNLRAALAAEMRLIRRAVYDSAKRAHVRAGESASDEPLRRIPTPVFEATAGSLGLLGSSTLISRIVRLSGTVDSLPETIAEARSSGTSDTAHVRAGDLLLSLWRRARELEVQLADRDLEEIPPHETQLFAEIEAHAGKLLAATERAGVTQTVLIQLPKAKR
jgi:hypothetical protein